MRVLAIDDSLFFRNLLRKALQACEEVSFLATAADAKDALKILEAERFDLIFVDLNMYKVNGIDFIKRLRERKNSTPVFILSSASLKEIEDCISHANLGAIDYILKPENKKKESPELVMRQLLLPYVKNTKKVTPTLKPKAPSVIRNSDQDRKHITQLKVEALVIGSSTGGPQVLGEILSQLNPPPFPIFLSQHMPDAFITAFTERLNGMMKFPAVCAKPGELVASGKLYVSHSGKSLVIKRIRNDIFLDYVEQSGPNDIFPSVNHLFSSAAKVYEAGLLGVVLTGMGSDGTEGAKLIKELKGHIITQTQESSVVYGMPASIDQNNLSDLSLSPAGIVEMINTLTLNNHHLAQVG